MNKSLLLIFNMSALFSILKEHSKITSFDVIKLDNLNELKKFLDTKKEYFLIISKKKIDIKGINCLILDRFPLKFETLIQKINLSLLKNKFQSQSDLEIRDYKLNINSRVLSKKNVSLKLTQKESEIILFLSNSKKSKSVPDLQKEVWGHNSNLETHTVETHIYRLRKKISDKFSDQEFILNNKDGYYL